MLTAVSQKLNATRSARTVTWLYVRKATAYPSITCRQQQFFPSIDLNVSPEWELNFGVGVGVTRSTDHLIIKGIIGRRFSWRRK